MIYRPESEWTGRELLTVILIINIPAASRRALLPYYGTPTGSSKMNGRSRAKWWIGIGSSEYYIRKHPHITVNYSYYFCSFEPDTYPRHETRYDISWGCNWPDCNIL